MSKIYSSPIGKSSFSQSDQEDNLINVCKLLVTTNGKEVTRTVNRLAVHQQKKFVQDTKKMISK